MRELAIGDIHGCDRAFETLLELISPRPDDTIILLGDYIDRGPDSCKVIDLILELNTQCTVIALAGNHEKMLLQAATDPVLRDEWLKHGGHATLESYRRRGFAKAIDAIPAEHWKFFTEQTLDYWETDETIYVHASVDPDVDLAEQSELSLFWLTFMNPTVHKSGKPVICGHTSQKSGLPAIFDRGICIDTWVYGAGWLTCLDVQGQKFFQSNEAGDQRFFTVEDLKREHGIE